jgi:cholesterol transport system auxiliary component
VSVRRLAILFAAPALAAALSGCISVLPKTKPDQLYTFGEGTAAAAPTPGPPAVGGPAVGVLLAQVDLPRAAQGDGILTRTGLQAAYIAQSRWSAPAAVLFREAAERAFDRDARRTRLIARGESGRTALVLRLDVLDFAALYPNGQGSAPTVVVSVRGRLAGPDGTVIEDKTFDVRKRAGDNRVGPIVEAFNAAVDEALAGVVAWTDQTAARLPPTRAGMPAAPAPRVTSTTRSTTVTTTQAAPAPAGAPASPAQ